MNGHSKLKGFTNTRSFDTGTNASPESRVEQNHIHSGVQHIGGELFKIHNHSVCRERHAYLFSHSSHPCHSQHRIFQIVVTQVHNLLPKLNRRLSRPHAIRIESKAVSIKR